MLCKSVIIPLISYKRYDLVINEDIFKVLIIWVKTSRREMQNAFLSLLKPNSTLVALNSNSMWFSLQPEPTTLLVEMYKIKAEILWCSKILERLCYNIWGHTDFINTWEWNLSARHIFFRLILKNLNSINYKSGWVMQLHFRIITWAGYEVECSCQFMTPSSLCIIHCTSD